MGYLEKVFLGTLLLFALVIVFMFGLYFDVGSMLQGALKKTGDEPADAYSRATSELERNAVTPEVTPSSTSRELPREEPPRMDASAAERAFAEIYARCSEIKPPPTFEERMDFKRKEMAKKGESADYIEMHVRAMDERNVDAARKKTKELMDANKPDEAEAYLLDQLNSLDPRDMITQERLRMMLQNVYFDQTPPKLDEYKKAIAALFELQEKILAVDGASKSGQEKQAAETLQQKRETLEKKKGEFEDYFPKLQEYVGRYGTTHLTAASMTDVKAEMLHEQEAGHISAEGLQSVLAKMEEQASKSGK